MIASTKAIVLKNVKYGDSSLICTLLTEHFGLQSFMVKGVRQTQKSTLKGNLLQYGNILEISFYRHPGKNLQYLKDFAPAYFYTEIGEKVIKNTIVLFMVEVLSQLLLQDQPQEEVFYFTEEFLLKTDQTAAENLALFPLFFIKHTAELLGYSIDKNYKTNLPFFNVHEGAFTAHVPTLPPHFDKENSEKIHRFLNINCLEELSAAGLPATLRAELLDAYILFLQQHAEQFKTLKSLPILHTILH